MESRDLCILLGPSGFYFVGPNLSSGTGKVASVAIEIQSPLFLGHECSRGRTLVDQQGLRGIWSSMTRLYFVCKSV